LLALHSEITERVFAVLQDEYRLTIFAGKPTFAARGADRVSVAAVEDFSVDDGFMDLEEGRKQQT
jgi:hypothetical protein